MNKQKEVKMTLGYDFGLSKDTFSKEKASEFLSVSIGGDNLDNKELRKEARAEARELVKELREDIKIILKEGGEEIKLDIEELKSTRNDLIDKLRAELSAEYDDKLAKAKEMILALREENKLLKEKK